MTDRPYMPDAFVDEVGMLLDGRADAAVRRRIEEAMAADEACVALYRELVQVDAILNWIRRRAPVAMTNADLATRHAQRRALRPMTVSGSAIRVPRFAYALAAALLLAACGVAIYIGAFATPSPERPVPGAPSPVATVIDTTDGGTLVVNNDIATAGAIIRTGEVALDTGSAEFRLHSGVEVKIRGATRLTLHDPMNATLAAGSATFTCPPAAKGYTVGAPHGVRFVDMGTRFEVTIDADTGASRMRVLEGRVDLHLPGAEPIVVTAAKRVRVDLVNGRAITHLSGAPPVTLAGDVHLDDATALGGKSANGAVFGLADGFDTPSPAINGVTTRRVDLVNSAVNPSPTTYSFESRDAASGALYRFDVVLEGFAVSGGVTTGGRNLRGVTGAQGVDSGWPGDTRDQIDSDTVTTRPGDSEFIRMTLSNVRVVEPGSLTGGLAPVGFTAVNVRSAAESGDTLDAGEVRDALTGVTRGVWTGSDFRELVTLDEPALSVDVVPTGDRATIHGFRVRFAPAPPTEPDQPNPSESK